MTHRADAPRPTLCWTSSQIEDIRTSQPQLLVARHVSLRQKLRYRLRHLSTDEEPSATAFWTTYAQQSTKWTLGGYLNRFNHSVTSLQWPRHYMCSGGPLYQASLFLPNYQQVLCKESGYTTSRSGISPSRTSKSDHFRPWNTVRCPTLLRVVQAIGN